jgi:hypothetical protein
MAKTDKTVCNRYIKVSRLTGDGDKKQLEEVSLVPGQEVPDWAVELLDPQHLGSPRDPLEEQDQFLVALRETATREGIKWNDRWEKEHLSQAITAVRQAAAGGHSIDTTQFGPAAAPTASEADSESQSGSGEQLKPLDQMSRDELDAEHQRVFNEKPHHALSDSNLRTRLQEARDKG